MKKLLQRMLDESEFLSDYGVRAISRNHLEHPYVFRVDGMDLAVKYSPQNLPRDCSAATRTGVDRFGSR